MGEVNKIHDAENQRQSGSQQKQQHTQLQSIEHLDQDERAVHDQGTFKVSCAGKSG